MDGVEHLHILVNSEMVSMMDMVYYLQIIVIIKAVFIKDYQMDKASALKDNK